MSFGLTFSEVALIAVSPFVGSFLGVLVDRLPRDEGYVTGRSKCRSCKAALEPRDLVPLLSWVVSKGRCRHCGATIGVLNPAIEIGAMGIAIWVMLVVPGWAAWPSAVLGWALLALAVIDWRHLFLPDDITLPLLPLGLAVAAFSGRDQFLDHAIGAAVGGLFLTLIMIGYQRIAGRDGLGFGDVKLFAAAGAWVGWQGLPSVLLVGAGSGLVAALLLGLAKSTERMRAPIAFGPFLALGLWLTWLYGPIEIAGI